MLNEELYTTRPVRRDDLKTAWGILLEAYDDYCRKHPKYRPSRMDYSDFEEIFDDRCIEMYFAESDSKPVGVFYVVSKFYGRKNLSRFWIRPEWEDKGVFSYIIRSFELLYKDANSLSIGTLQLTKCQIKECEKLGWVVSSRMERIYDGVAVVDLERKF